MNEIINCENEHEPVGKIVFFFGGGQINDLFN